jgi:peptidoglycan/LPS O-acetylase OafA/YrhL
MTFDTCRNTIDLNRTTVRDLRMRATPLKATDHELLRGGSIGVSIFSCLSGFLITRILLRLPELSILNVGKFIFRRFMRVWP